MFYFQVVGFQAGLKFSLHEIGYALGALRGAGGFLELVGKVLGDGEHAGVLLGDSVFRNQPRAAGFGKFGKLLANFGLPRGVND